MRVALCDKKANDPGMVTAFQGMDMLVRNAVSFVMGCRYVLTSD